MFSTMAAFSLPTDFREMMRNRHKAYELAEWCVVHLKKGWEIATFALIPLRDEVVEVTSQSWWDY